MILSIIVLVDLLLIGILAFTPYVTRKTELFGVSIPSAEANRPECRELRNAYRNRMLILSIPFLAFSMIPYLQMGPENSTAITVFTIAVFIYLLLGFGVYLLGHKAAKQLKRKAKWAAPAENAALIVDTTPPAGELISPAWLLLYPAILICTIIGIGIVWDKAPETIPMHYDALGNVTRYEPKSIQALLPMLGSQIFLMLVFTGIFFITRNAKRQIDAANPEVSREQGRQFRRFTSISLLVGGAALSIFLGMLQILMLLNVPADIVLWVSLGGILPITVVIPVLYMRIGQGGSRLKSAKRTDNKAANYDDDRYWKLGQFYYNRDDPAIFVEKRFGIGYTNNWAHPVSWLMMGGLLVLIVGSLIATFVASGSAH